MQVIIQDFGGGRGASHVNRFSCEPLTSDAYCNKRTLS